jgi:low temperature requirement protein LtrA
LSDERRTSPVELLWDLVFVFAVTQVTTLLARDLTWAGFGRAMLALALIWWAWSAFVWAANAADERSLTMRASLLGSMVLIFVTGVAVPHAFGDEGWIFAGTYAAVRFIHLALYADASRRGNARWESIAGFAVTVAIGMALLLAGAAVHGGTRVALWAVAAAIDYAGPAVLTRRRLRGLQQVAVAHFAERYGLFVIICLGESVVGIGLAAGHHHLDGGLAGVVAIGALIVVGLWWTYFGRVADEAETRLASHDDTVLAAADAYSYGHLLIVAGIIVFAVGAKAMVGAVGDALGDPARLALCGGLALYLAGHAAFRIRLLRSVPWLELLAAAAQLVLFAIGGGFAAWVAGAVAAALLAGLVLGEHD